MAVGIWSLSWSLFRCLISISQAHLLSLYSLRNGFICKAPITINLTPQRFGVRWPVWAVSLESSAGTKWIIYTPRKAEASISATYATWVAERALHTSLNHSSSNQLPSTPINLHWNPYISARRGETYPRKNTQFVWGTDQTSRVSLLPHLRWEWKLVNNQDSPEVVYWKGKPDCQRTPSTLLKMPGFPRTKSENSCLVYYSYYDSFNIVFILIQF